MTADRSREALTFLFTDLESSTRLWERFPEAMRGAMERHDAILRDAVETADGRVVKVTGDGLMAVFASPTDGARAGLEAQRALQTEAWGDTGPLRVRMGIHVGPAQERAGDFFGPTVIRAARIMAAAHGSQVLLSATAAEDAGAQLPADADLRDLGEHRLKDLRRSERIFQLVHPELASEFPPLETLSERPNNLPTQTSEFLGRETELVAVRDLLDAEGVRLLTLTGPGGIGKTRLALQAAADQIDRFEDGVYFVDLSPVRDAAEAFEAIAGTVESGRPRDDHPLEAVKRELGGRHLLLLLDNFEQVMDAADGVAELLQQCSSLKLVVTSREALRIRGEHLFLVPPMRLPVGHPSAEAVEDAEAARLFVDRAREARPSFALTDDNAGAVAEICTRLDGLPLAIELAAARLNLFSAAELRRRLQSGLELLSEGPRDLPERQQTLRDTIAWSYDLLDDEERAIFGLVSLFHPGRVETVEGVAERLDSLRGIDVVGRLASLVDKSLVRSIAGSEGRRLSMLETIREYAADRLAQTPGLGDAATRAHAEFFADFAQQACSGLTGPERADTLDVLEREMGNLVAAWRYWVEAEDFGHLNQLVDALWSHHDARGWYQQAVWLTNDLLGVLASAPSTPERARKEITLRTSLARGLLAIRGYTEEVEETYVRALELCEQLGEVPRLFPVLSSLATFHLYRGEFEKTAGMGRKLLDLAEQEDDAGLQVEGHLLLGAATAFMGRIGDGLEHLDSAVELFDPVRNPPGRFRLGPSAGVAAHTTSGLLLWLLGRPDRALERAALAEELSRRLDHPFTLAYALFHIGLLDLWRADYERALERSLAVQEVAADHDYAIWTALALSLEGAAASALGRPEDGDACIERGIALYSGLKTPPVFWPLLLTLRAGSAGLAGRASEGVELVDQAIALGGDDMIQRADLEALRGELLLAQGHRDAAVACFRAALDAAERGGTRMAELRAAVWLCRVADASEAPVAAGRLRRVYATFTEGFETAALVDARAALDEAEDRVTTAG